MKKKSGIFRLLELAGSKKTLLSISGITVIIHALLSIVPYIIVYYIIQQLLVQVFDRENINDLLFWGAISVVLSFIFLYLSIMSSHIAAFKLLYDLRCKMAEKLGALPMGYLTSKSSGGLKKILSDDIERIETFIAHGIPDFIKGMALPFIFIIYLFTVDWRLALVSLIPLVSTGGLVISVFSSKKVKELMKYFHDSLEDMNAGIVEYVRAIPVMKIFGQTADAFERYSGSVNKFDHFIKAWTRKSTPIWAIFMSFISNASLPILAVGTYLYFSNGLSLSVFLLFLILGVGYMRPVLALSTLGSQMSLVNAGISRLDEILFEVEEQTEGNQKFPIDSSIDFDQVHFQYEENVEVLKAVSMSVKKGSITALVGPSGSGKSTLAKLIARFYDVNKGEIKIGGINIKDFSIASLMANISFVFQDNQMFYDTIFNNIRMGGEYTKEEVIAAAKVARCHDFIMKLPHQYEAKFGEKGIHFSGGEQQRIQLARAVLKDAPILILDEATAFSDPENEHQIMAAMSALIQDKTVIVVAHRLSTIAEVDQILVFDKGELVQSGRHENLLKEGGLYLNMWNAHTRSQNFEIL